MALRKSTTFIVCPGCGFAITDSYDTCASCGWTKPPTSDGPVECLVICQHCGSKEGYYRITVVSGKTTTHYNADGSVGDNTDMHDPVKYTERKAMYCVMCEKRIGFFKGI